MAHGVHPEAKKLKQKTDEEIIKLYIDQLRIMAECSLKINTLGIVMGERHISVNDASMSIALSCENSTGHKRSYKLAMV